MLPREVDGPRLVEVAVEPPEPAVEAVGSAALTEMGATPPACPYCRRHTWFQAWRITGGKGTTWVRPTGVTVEPFVTRDAVRSWECSNCHAEPSVEIARRLEELVTGSGPLPFSR